MTKKATKTSKNEVAEPKKNGRPTEFNPVRHPKIIMAMAGNGATQDEIAEVLAISSGRFNDWKNKYPEVSEALAFNGKALDSEIQGTAWKEANGYHIKEPIYDIEGNITGYQDRWIKPNTVILKLLLAHRLGIRENPLPSDDTKKNDVARALQIVSNFMKDLPN